MLKLLLFVVIGCFVCCCYGKPVAENEIADNVKRLSETTLSQLQNLLDENLLKEMYSSMINHNIIKEATISSRNPPIAPKSPIPIIRFGEVAISPNKSPLDYSSFPTGQLSLTNTTFEKKPQQINLLTSDAQQPIKSRPFFIIIFGDKFQEIIASSTQKPAPTEGQLSQSEDDTIPLSFEDRFQEVVPSSSKSPLDYHGQRPSFAGQFSNGQPSQLIPSGSPLPAAAVPVKDRFEDDNDEPQIASSSTTTKSPLEYQGQKPSFAGQFSNGIPSQLIPSRNPSNVAVPVKDRFKDENGEPQVASSTTTKSPLENHGQRPSFAGQFSNGVPTQLIPSEPANPLNSVPVKNRFEDDINEKPQIASSTTTKSPLEYHGQKPSFAGQFSNGIPSQLIPSKPANLLNSVPVNVRFEDDNKNNDEPQIASSTTTKSPLEYHGQRPSFAGQFSNGQPSQLISSGSLLPAGPLNSASVKDLLEESAKSSLDSKPPQVILKLS